MLPSSLVQLPERKNPLNIIVLITDDQRWDTLGAAGNSAIQTPSLDSLAERGVLFENAFVTTSICATSRASILTGQYARRHGIWDFAKGLTPEQLEKSYLGQLKYAGYQVGFIGKWGVGEPPKDFFDYDRSFPGQGQYWVEKDGQRKHLTSLMGDQVLECLERFDTESPFCISVSFKAAHVQDSYDLGTDPFPFDLEFGELYAHTELPSPVSARHELFERLPGFLRDSENRMRWAVRFWGPKRTQESLGGYYRLISGVDRVVGRIRRALEESNLAQKTVLIFSSDNGFFLGEYGLAGKWLPHDPSIRVPLLIYHPEWEARLGPKRIKEMVLNIDLAPTIVELAGLRVPPEMQGRSLQTLVSEETPEWRSDFFYEHLFEHPRIPPCEALRTERWKYSRYLDSVPVFEELYDMTSDPNEESNLADDPRYLERLQQMRVRLRQWRRMVQ
jgi:arylsulfatase A-like enzyme